jgi:UDP:flavonoid glycosyltransferase YjiC (YdhE family)
MASATQLMVATQVRQVLSDPSYRAWAKTIGEKISKRDALSSIGQLVKDTIARHTEQ